jgi:hypothetical protein
MRDDMAHFLTRWAGAKRLCTEICSGGCGVGFKKLNLIVDEYTRSIMFTKIPARKFLTLKQITLPSVRAKIDGQNILVNMAYCLHTDIGRGMISISTVLGAAINTTWEGYIAITKDDSVDMYEFLRQIAMTPAIAAVRITGSHSGYIDIRFRVETRLNDTTGSHDLTVVEISLELLSSNWSTASRTEIAGGAAQK